MLLKLALSDQLLISFSDERRKEDRKSLVILDTIPRFTMRDFKN